MATFFSDKAQQIISLLYEEECRKPRKVSEKQKEGAKEQVKKMRQEGGGFDQMPPSEHKKVSQEGGESKRKKQLPECKGSNG